MTRDIARQQDDLVRTLRRVDDSVLALGLDPALRDALAQTLTDEPRQRHSWRQAHRRLAVTLGVTGAMVVSTAAAYAGHEAWQRLHPDQAVTVACVDSQDDALQPLGLSVPIGTGDPLADCAVVWKQQSGKSAPELAAYVGSNGTVMVQPKAWKTPADWEPLAEDFSLDTALLELDHSLQDHVHGLAAKCLSGADGDALAEQTLTRLGLDGWTVDQRDKPDGVKSCAGFVVADPEEKVVKLMGQKPSKASDVPFEAMAAELRKSQECLDHDQALAEVKRAAKVAGMPDGVEGYELSEPGSSSHGAGSDCTRIVMIVGGSVMVELW
jgi:hypothetical protein